MLLLNKPIFNLQYSDIEELKKKQITESETLDYKDMKIDKENLIKEVTAFSNTSGGLLIYGIKETGDGGYPESINGIENNVNRESLEQKILDSIRPRISVQFREINIPESNKIILIIRIPEGQNKPYYNSGTSRYYKRYNFQAKPMDEHEIEALYQKRFFGVAKLAKYIDETILFKRSKLQESFKKIDCHIIITPLRIDDRRIDTSNKELKDLDPNNMRLEPKSNGQYLLGFSKPSRYGIIWNGQDQNQSVEIHRNGLIHYMDNYGLSFDDISGKKTIWDYGLACNLLQTIQFADIVYSKSSFIGKVRIVLKVMNSTNTEITKGRIFPSLRSSYKCDAEEIYIEREWDSWKLKQDYSEIGKTIMDEVCNYYGLWESDMFKEENGVIKFSSKK